MPEAHIHAEEAGYEGRGHEHKRDQGKDLHNLVLVQVDDTDDGILEIFETLETEIGMINQEEMSLSSTLNLG